MDEVITLLTVMILKNEWGNIWLVVMIFKKNERGNIWLAVMILKKMKEVIYG